MKESFFYLASTTTPSTTTTITTPITTTTKMTLIDFCDGDEPSFSYTNIYFKKCYNRQIDCVASNGNIDTTSPCCLTIVSTSNDFCGENSNSFRIDCVDFIAELYKNLCLTTTTASTTITTTTTTTTTTTLECIYHQDCSNDQICNNNRCTGMKYGPCL